MSIGRSNHLSFALEEFPTAVCSPSTTPDYPETTTQEFQTTTSQESEDTTTPMSDTTTTATTSSATGLPPQCFVAGECEGDLIGIFAGTVGADDCLAACRNTSGCVWFTEYEVKLIAFSPTHLIYYPYIFWLQPDDFCGLFENCRNIDTQTCPSCVSG